MKFKLAALAAMMAIGVTPAHAVSSSSASFTNIVFQLVDLNPADGIEASLTFVTGTGYGTVVSSYANLNDPDTGYESGSSSKNGVRSTTAKSTSQNFGSVTTNANVVGNNATTLTGAGTYTTALSSMSASGSAASPTVGGYANYGAGASSTSYGQNFLLSANTILIVTATGSVTAQNSVGYDSMTGQTENSYASLSFYINGSGPSGTGSQGSSDSFSAYNPYWYGYSSSAQSDSRSVGGSFMNLTGSNLAGTLSMQANVSGDSYVVSPPAPVPEPESYAMMLAGLAAIGAMARRRKQK